MAVCMVVIIMQLLFVRKKGKSNVSEAFDNDDFSDCII